MLVWVAIGVGALIALSLLVGFALARVLGTIAREVSELYETEMWSTKPPTRMGEVTQRESVEEGSEHELVRAERGIERDYGEAQ